MNWVRVFLSPDLLESRDYVGLQIHVAADLGLKTSPMAQTSEETFKGCKNLLSGSVRSHECSISHAWCLPPRTALQVGLSCFLLCWYPLFLP